MGFKEIDPALSPTVYQSPVALQAGHFDEKRPTRTSGDPDLSVQQIPGLWTGGRPAVNSPTMGRFGFREGQIAVSEAAGGGVTRQVLGAG